MDDFHRKLRAAILLQTIESASSFSSLMPRILIDVLILRIVIPLCHLFIKLTSAEFWLGLGVAVIKAKQGKRGHVIRQTLTSSATRLRKTI